MNFRKVYKLVLVSFVLVLQGCVEEVKIETENFESILVIEATITNEDKNQIVKLSRSYMLEEEGPSNEINANVTVQGQNGEIYQFQEVLDGVYESTQAFAAMPNYDYVLKITTSDGRQYQSNTSQFSNTTEIGELYVERGIDSEGEEGVFILVDTQDSSLDSRYYRYEYEETYKIVAPRYAPYDLHIENDDFVYTPDDLAGLQGQQLIDFFVSRSLRPEQEYICYNTIASNEILLLDASDFVDNNIMAHSVNFLNRNNSKIMHRYSILVKQYVQSLEGYLFYEALSSFSNSESVFSQVQAGFVQGNISSLTNANEKVLGFFEVVPVDSERMFFNFADLFPDEELPPYFVNCEGVFTPALYTTDMITGDIVDSPLQFYVSRDYQYYENNHDDNGFVVTAPYNLVLPECGDCTFLGDNQAPDFWIE